MELLLCGVTFEWSFLYVELLVRGDTCDLSYSCMALLVI